jgi:hypothetical protein
MMLTNWAIWLAVATWELSKLQEPVSYSLAKCCIDIEVVAPIWIYCNR